MSYMGLEERGGGIDYELHLYRGETGRDYELHGFGGEREREGL